MTEESGEPKPNKLKLSSLRNQPDKQQSALEPKDSTPVSSTVAPKTDSKVTLRTASTQATPTPIAAKPVAEPTPPPQAKQPAPKATPPPLVRKSPLSISNSAPTSAEQPASPIPSPPPKDGPLGSIMIVAALLLILAAAAGGIWYLFQSDQSEPTEEAAPQEASPANPIERTKAVIDKVSDRTLDPVLEPQSAPPPEATAALETPEPAAGAAPTRDLKETVSQYLQHAHIEGVRTGARARIRLNGENYNINDTVDATTGLIFIGTRDQKLRFKDSNGIVYHKSF